MWNYPDKFKIVNWNRFDVACQNKSYFHFMGPFESLSHLRYNKTLIDSRSASLSFPRSSKLVFQFWLRLRFTAGRWDSISLNVDSFYHWSQQFASRKGCQSFPAQYLNCHKLRTYQSVIRKCCASVITYRLSQATRWLMWLALLQAKLIDRSNRAHRVEALDIWT